MLSNQHRNNLLKACTLAIHSGGSSPLAQCGTVVGKIDGVIMGIATQDLPALSDFDIADGYSRFVSFYTDGTTESLEYSDEIANTADKSMKDVPGEKPGLLLIGFIHIKNASGATFDGGTTNLDASNIATTYYDNFGIIGDL